MATPLAPNSFRPVNTDYRPDRHGDDTTPTTPRPNTAPHSQPLPMSRIEDATTPTRATFNNSNALANQRPLPVAPFPAEINVPQNVPNDRIQDVANERALNRNNSTTTRRSQGSEDVDMDGSDDEKASDDESVNADGSRSNKKKKVTRFFCNDYPPCALSFTRSEHLARHIRKHTGERPFVCHCSRRFSRLDNLRQHAQTVHLNEEIPPESLAATGTRFQRQIRTDRVRPTSSRSRAATTSQGNPPRGHTRGSLSTSSIGSVASTFSQGGGMRDMRSRPPPLQVGDNRERARFSQEIYPESPSNPFQYRPNSPGGFSTPTSATFSTGPNSPRWGSGVQSPLSGFSRSSSLYGHHTPGRRLSVPSVGNPFSAGQSMNQFGAPAHMPLMSSYSPANTMISSPTSSVAGSFYTRRDSMSSNMEMDNRRRTWHPDTASAYTSRLQNVITPNHYSNGPPPPPTSVVPSNAPPIAPPITLPGIESFDPIPRQSPGIQPRRVPSPMMVDTPNDSNPARPAAYRGDRPISSHMDATYHPSRITGYREERPVSSHMDTAYNSPRSTGYRDERPVSSHLDASFQRRFNHLEIQSSPQTDAAAWASDTTRAVQATAEQSQNNQPRVMFEPSTYAPRSGPSSSYHHHTASLPANLPRGNRRDAWYHGPLVPSQMQDQRVQGTSPEGSSSSEGNLPATPPSATAAHPQSDMYQVPYMESESRQYPREAMQHPPLIQYMPPNRPDTSYTYHPNVGYAPPTYGVPQGHPLSQQAELPKSPDAGMNRLDALVAVATSGEHATATSY